jgi:hypothetical protein
MQTRLLFKVREKTKKKTKRVSEILIIDFNSYDSNNTIIKRLNVWLSFFGICVDYVFAGAVSRRILITINLEVKINNN